MSARLPRITATQLVRVLKRVGWVEVRQKGSHLSLEYADKQVVVPMHAGRILKPGTLKSILKQAELSVDDLQDLLKG